jgi:hypothetical protein
LGMCMVIIMGWKIFIWTMRGEFRRFDLWAWDEITY